MKLQPNMQSQEGVHYRWRHLGSSKFDHLTTETERNNATQTQANSTTTFSTSEQEGKKIDSSEYIKDGER